MYAQMYLMQLTTKPSVSTLLIPVGAVSVISTYSGLFLKYCILRHSLSYASLPISFHTNKGVNSGHTRASVLCFTMNGGLTL